MVFESNARVLSVIRCGAMAVACALAVSLGACGDEHENSAKAKCETLVETFCETVTSCADDADLLADGYSPRELLADCKETVGRGAHCGDAKQISSRYEGCLSAASERLDCEESNQSLLVDESFAVPAQCEGVIQY
jgi:hypothetical protein